MNNETLIELTIKEAKALKLHATAEELARLDFDCLQPESGKRCIYGQMTGSCFSERASELIITCAERVYEEDWDEYHLGTTLNGAPNAEIIKGRREHFSPIECFIWENKDSEDNNKPLVDFLKGKTDELNLTIAKRSRENN